MNSVFDITLGRPFNLEECIAYNGHWCDFCNEDNGGGKFCYNCGKRQIENEKIQTKELEVEDEDGIYLDTCEACGCKTAPTLCPKNKKLYKYYCIICLDDESRYADEDDLFAALMAEA